MQPDLYSILQAERTATDEQLKRAYRQQALRWHPDRNPGDEEALRRFKESAYAYAVLSDPVKRLQYDRFGRVFGETPGNPFSGEVDLGAVVGTLFRDLFGRRKRGGPDPRDVRYTVTISLEEAASGTTKDLRFERTEGSSRIEERLRVRVPAGVDTGQKLKVPGKGFGGAAGTGDLYVLVNVAEHSFFKRRGADVFCDVPVTYVQVVLGAELEVPTLLAPAVVRLPPGSAPGTVLTLKGRGLPGVKGGRGDLHARVVLDLPGPLTAEQKDRLMSLDRELAASPSNTRRQYEELLRREPPRGEERAS